MDLSNGNQPAVGRQGRAGAQQEFGVHASALQGGQPMPHAEQAGAQPGGQPQVDPLTGGLGIAAFSRECSKILARGGCEDLAIWFFDIRNFRSVNPKYGYEAGNGVLRCVRECIAEFLAKDLPVARLGGDRFAYLTECLDTGNVQEHFEDFAARANERCRGIGIGHPLEFVAGVYFLRKHDYEGGKVQRLLDYASVAHRSARMDAGNAVSVFTEEDLERDNRRIAIEQSVDEALVNGQIQVWFQPQIDYMQNKVIGAEALARWRHPELGWISPAEFIPILERCGKVHKLDLFIWEEACRSASRWRNAAGDQVVPISVNVSRAEMFEPGLMEHFLDLQEKYDLADGSLHLEVTESAFVEEAERLYEIIERMREHRMKVEMDDFGSGLSSLNMLKDIPVDVVKLDMGFIRSSVGEERGGVVLGSVIRMLQGLETPIIAEGVETLEQAEMLKNMGCHLMQGFHFSRPMPFDEFEEFISQNKAGVQSELAKHEEFRLEEIMNFDPTMSYLFNRGIGGTMIFFAGDGTSESIMVNDEFYEQCGLKRTDFGDAKINPIEEIAPETREALWKAAARAHVEGGVLCNATVRMTGRDVQFVMRFLGHSSRGDVYSLNIVNSRPARQGDSSQAVE